MCWKTVVITVNLIMFGVTCTVLSYNAGMLKDNRRIAMVSIPADCNIMAGHKDELTAMLDMAQFAAPPKPQEVKLTRNHK